MKSQWTPAATAAWRASIPFSDAQIVKAIRDEALVAPNEFKRNHYNNLAAFVERTGKLPKLALSLSIHRLVTVCTLCGKKALYRLGTSGRCRKHRLEPFHATEARKLRLNNMAHERTNAMNERDKHLRRADALIRKSRNTSRKLRHRTS